MNKALMAVATILSITFSSAASVKAANGPQLSRPFEWTIQITTQELPGQFQYAGSLLNRVFKAGMEYYPVANENDRTAYEDVWYGGNNTLGLERHHKLEIRQGDAVAIRVVHKNPSASSEEQHAAGKSIMKALLDSSRNKNMVAIIRVPYQSFYSISSEIQNYHFSPAASSGAGNPVNSDMNLFLQSEPAGLSQNFAHYH